MTRALDLSYLTMFRKFKAARARSGMTQEQVVAKSGVSLATVQRSEQQGMNVSMESACLIALSQGMTIELVRDQPLKIEGCDNE